MTESVEGTDDTTDPGAELIATAHDRMRELLDSATRLASARMIRPAAPTPDASVQPRREPPRISQRVSLRRHTTHLPPVLRRRPRL
ncbi:hypothetical protein [Nocardia tengchongensis]|uniref:hypothetical protein n=1 Tax=Nocardia tengchongensis TaxID=2055889 RepID=UPI00369E797A